MTAKTLPVSEVVNVTVELSPVAASLRNFGACLVLGTSDIIDTDERIREYSGITDIAEDFGTTSDEYLAAQAFFSQSPQPSLLYVGRWASTATAGRWRGSVLSTDAQDIDDFNDVTEGTLTLTIDGEYKTFSGIDLSAESNLNGVASQVTTALAGAGTCLWTGTRFTISSATTGADSSVVCSDTGDLSTLMGLPAGSSVKGVDSETLADCITDLLDYQSWYALILAAEATDEVKIAAAGLIEAASPSRMIGFTTTNTSEIDPTATSTLGTQLQGLGYNRSVLMYSSTNAQAVASVFGRMATVDFEGSNTTITLKFKQCPGVTAENLRSSQSSTLRSHNVNTFAAYQNDTSILREGVTCGGWYIDETHGLDWLQNRVETDIWNLLYSSKKVGQDESGATAIISCITKSLEQGVTNGLIAPGVWNSDGFGALETGDTLAAGYYVYIQPFDEQSQSDREARKAPPIQIAVKLKGAIHFVDVAITVNR